jgi:DNA/RNA non-specific endonuclease
MLAYIYPGTDVLKGSAPQGGTWPSWWDKAKPKSSDWWVRGHLLNEHLGGPGTKENLTPITKAANSRHHSTVEKLVKAAQSKNKMLAYSVKAIYDGVGPNLVDDRDKNPDKSVWSKITCMLDCEWEFYDENNDMTASGAATITNEQRA